jgi:uncharacterized protein with FMN-binding domain
MRRIIMALLAVVAGTTLLVGLKSNKLAVPLGLVTEESLDPASGGEGVPGGLESGVTTGPTGSGEAMPTVGVSASANPQASALDQGTGAPDPGTGSPSTTVPAADPPPGVSGTFAGNAVAVETAQSPNTRSRPCGDCHAYSMSVTITVSNNQITDVTVAYSTDPGESQRYADKATNTLSPRILTAQTWQLGNVSGATYSANAFELSAKDAMAKAGLPT